jgi:diacylglycerol O-acyltransferase
VKRLTGLDAGFLWMETSTSAMHVAAVAIYDPPSGPDARTFGVDSVKEMVRGRLHLAPPFRQRLVTVPFELHFPLWIEDPDFDLDHHIKRIAVPSPGGARELAELAAQLNAMQLDRARPLWEMWFIEGLEGGRFATLTKVHHAAIDGASGSEITVALFDLSAEIAEHTVAEPWKPDPVPSDLEMLTYAGRSLARQPLQLFGALKRTVKAALDVRSLTQSPGSGLAALPFTAPATSINGSISARRSVALSSLSLADVKKVKNAFGCTVNDVVLALSAATLRNYFERRGEEVDGPLIAMVPVSVRADDQHDAMGNQVSSMFTSLATDVADPVARLLAIHDGMKGAKEQHKAIGADTLTNWAEFAAPAVFGSAMRLYARLGLADRHRPIFNVTISNVPGPPFPLYSAGAQLEANFPLGPIFDGAALNITVMGYRDSLDVGILTCPDVVDQVWLLSDGLQAALDELLAAADALPTTSAGADDTASTAAGTSSVATPAEKQSAPAKASRPTKKTRPAKKAAPAKRAVAAKKAAPAKKAAVAKKVAAKKSVAAKKQVPAKKAPVRTVAAKKRAGHDTTAS